jgi:hypothetical protein
MFGLLATVEAVDREAMTIKLVPRTPAIWPSEFPQPGDAVDLTLYTGDRCDVCGREATHGYCSDFFERSLSISAAAHDGYPAIEHAQWRLKICRWCATNVLDRLREIVADIANIERYGIPCHPGSTAGSGRDRQLAER